MFVRMSQSLWKKSVGNCSHKVVFFGDFFFLHFDKILRPVRRLRVNHMKRCYKTRAEGDHYAYSKQIYCNIRHKL